MAVFLSHGDFAEQFSKILKAAKEQPKSDKINPRDNNKDSKDKKETYTSNLLQPNPYSTNGSARGATVAQQQHRYWGQAEMISILPRVLAIVQIFYFLTLLYGRILEDKRLLVQYFIYIIILTSLSFCRSKTTKYVTECVSATILLIILLRMESAMFTRNQVLATFLGYIVLARVFSNKSVFDNFAVCVAYSVNAIALNAHAYTWYFTSNLYLWSHLLIALLLLFVYKRLWFRVWEHVRLMVVLGEKTRQEHRLSTALIAAHIHSDVLGHIFPQLGQSRLDCTIQSGKCFLRDASYKRNSVQEKASISAHEAPVDARIDEDHSRPAHTSIETHSRRTTNTEELLSAAVDCGLLPAYTEAQVCLAQLAALEGFDRRECAIIAISFGTDPADPSLSGSSASTGTCTSQFAAQHAAQASAQSIHACLDRLAAEHRITCVRKFGNVWIGCVGFFKTWEAQHINCFEAVLFACEASFLGNPNRMTYAVDCGSITGGFQNSLNFDLFGQEMHWLLMVLELKQYGKVIVGDAVQKLLNVHKRNFPELSAFKMMPKDVNLPWRAGSYVTVNVVENAVDVVGMDLLEKFITQVKSERSGHGNEESGVKDSADPSHPSTSTRDEAEACSVDWNLLRKLLAVDETQHRPFQQRHTEAWAAHDGGPSLDQEVSAEFLLSASARFQLALDDPVLDKFTDQQLHDKHVALEQKLCALVRKECFPSFVQYVCLYSNYSDVKGSNEYTSIMSASYAFAYDWYAGPLRALLGGTFFAKYIAFEDVTPDVREFQARQKQAPHKIPPSAPESEILSTPISAPIKPKGKPKMTAQQPARRFQVPRVAPIAEVEAEADEDDALEPEDSGKAASPPPQRPQPEVPLSAKPVPLMLLPVPRLAQETPQRGWAKYAADSMVFFSDEQANGIVTIMFYAAMMYGAHSMFVLGTQASNASVFMCAMLLHLWIMLYLERRYDSYLSLALFGLNVVGVNALMNNIACFRMAFNSGSPTLPEVGDFNGELVQAFVIVVLIPFHMRQHVVLSFMDSIGLMLISFINRATTTQHCTKPTRYRAMTLHLFFILNLYYWVLQLLAYTSYLLEHKLLPAAVKNYNEQKANTRALLRAFAPSVPVSTSSCELYVQRSYQVAAVAALHVKVSNQIAHFVDPADLSAILQRIHRALEKCIAECGMLNVTHFSGVYLVAACKDSAWDSVESLRFPDSHTARTVVLLRTVRYKLAALSRELRFNIHLGIGVAQGPAQLGYLGQCRVSYDIAGPARDLAVAMSAFHGDGVFAGEAFEPDIMKMQAPEDLIRDVTSILEPGCGDGSRWLRIDGSFSGIQLEDFKYLCLLGQGGYGSVHLLAEKHTGVPYAIKAIELKQESKLTKMIERECSILQMVSHPNVVNLKYSFRNHNRLYLVMSYIRGGNLKQVVERDKLDLQHLLLWFAELVLAIEYLHSIGIIHRDIKPANCMIGTDGHLKLGDFGLSKVVISGNEIHGSARSAHNQEDLGGMSYDSYQKVRKFLPLKLDPSQREDAVESAAHRTLRILLITMDDNKADSTLLFINTTVEIAIADYDIDSETIRMSHFDAIFIDGDYYEQDSVELVAHFSTDTFGDLPVLLCGKDEDLRRRALVAGARACSRLPLESLTEETVDAIFAADRSEALSAAMQRYALDVIVLQEEREAAAAARVEDRQLSKDGQGFGTTVGKSGRDAANSRSRVSVEVESKSHSLVGTLHFIAPEVIKHRKYGKAVDWWACGITYYECLVRKHLFQGDDKKAVFDNIMNAPIELDELQPFGDPIMSLVRGLCNRDIRRRLGAHSVSAIKTHKVFEKIDWAHIQFLSPLHKPAQFVNRKYRADDKDLFYGPRGDHDLSLRPDNLEDKNATSMQKYLLNKKRAKMIGGGNSGRSSGKFNPKVLSEVSRKSAAGSGSNKEGNQDSKSKSASKSKSKSRSKESGSLELVAEAAQEQQEEG